MNDIDELLEKNLSRAFECRCGRRHRIGIEKIVIDAGAIHRLPRLIGGLWAHRRRKSTGPDRYIWYMTIIPAVLPAMRERSS